MKYILSLLLTLTFFVYGSFTVTQLDTNRFSVTNGSETRHFNVNSALSYQINNGSLIITNAFTETRNLGDVTFEMTNTVQDFMWESIFAQTSSTEEISNFDYFAGHDAITMNSNGVSIEQNLQLSNINNNVITSEMIQDGTIQSVDLADNSITSDKIQDGAIQSVDLADNSITSDKIQNNSITKAKLGADVLDEFKQLRTGIAIQSAISMASHGLANKKLTLNIGYGNYKSINAYAFGINIKANDHISFKFAGASDFESESSAAAGISFGF